MQNQPQVIEIALSDLIVSALRHLKQIIIFGIICALVFGCCQGFHDFLESRKTSASEALEKYERQLRDLQKTIERSNTGLSNERRYINESLYMGLNPYGSYLCEINLNLDDVDMPEDMRFGQNVNPSDYISAKILDQYMTIWNSFDLEKDLGIPAYSSVEDRYIRELLTVSSSAYGLTINAYEKNENDARALAKAAMDLLLGKTKDVIAVTYKHKLVQTAINAKLQISDEIKAAQEVHYDNIDTHIDNISEAEDSIKKLDPPDTLFKAIIKKVIIGALVGIIVSCCYLVIVDIFRGVLQSAGQLSSYTNIDCFGNIGDKVPGLYGNLLSSFARDKKYENDEAALSYMSEMTVSAVDGGKLLVSSTLDLPIDDSHVQKIMDAIKSKGVDAIYGSSINTNPDSLNSLKICDSVLLLEKSGLSKVKDIRDAKNLVNKLGKSTVGFALI